FGRELGSIWHKWFLPCVSGAHVLPYLIAASMRSSRRAAASQAQMNSSSSINCASSPATGEGSFPPISSSRSCSFIVPSSLVAAVHGVEVRLGNEQKNMTTVTQTISGTSTTGAEVRSRADKSRDSITMSPRKALARIAGFLWLVVGISGGFAQGFMEPKMYAAGNAAATAANVVANP